MHSYLCYAKIKNIIIFINITSTIYPIANAPICMLIILKGLSKNDVSAIKTISKKIDINDKIIKVKFITNLKYSKNGRVQNASVL